MLTARAYAKINLGLRILRKREDGYHDIETVFHRVNICDEVTISLSSKISLSCNRSDLPVDEGNLCTRAARMLQAKVNVKDGVHIQLTKSIPVGAGLGGGSSDAAATLLSLNKLWSLNLDVTQLEPLAIQLGSDVPYFLREGNAYATGRGETLERIDLDLPYWIVLAYPNIHISTAWAYENTQIPARPDWSGQSGGSNPQSPINLKQILLRDLDNARRFMTLLPNDFEPLILRTHPAVAQVKKALYELGAEFAQMSGSGSSVYGLFSNEESANNAAEKVKKNNQVFITPPHFCN